MQPRKINTKNFAKVLKRIKTYPHLWNQKAWHCGGGQHCFAGWAQVLMNRPADTATVRKDAEKFLGITSKAGEYLFSAERQIYDFDNVLEVAMRREADHKAKAKKAKKAQREAEEPIRVFKHNQEEQHLHVSR